MKNEGFENALSSVLGNEDLMSKISSIVESKKGDKEASLPEVIDLISSFGKNDDASQKAENGKEEVKTASVKGGFGFNLPSFSKNTELLCALKPYLSEKRANMLDSLLKIEQITEIMKRTK